MSKPKHTPGPWTVVIPRSQRFYNGSDITNFSVFAENEFHDQAKVDNKAIVNSQFTERLGLEESTANAHLIAAAPDMLEVLDLYGLQYTDEQLEQLATTESGRGEIGPYEARREIIRRAAIRKAKGEA